VRLYSAFVDLAARARTREGLLTFKKPHFAAGGHVIFLCMEALRMSTRSITSPNPPMTARAAARVRVRVTGAAVRVQKYGKSGLWISELSGTGEHADDCASSHHTDVLAHHGFQHLHTGSFQFKRPSLGAWTVYGLGSDNENLPGFVTISPPLNNGGPTNYGSGFLPAVFQATPISGGLVFAVMTDPLPPSPGWKKSRQSPQGYRGNRNRDDRSGKKHRGKKRR
jgi:hypothetical protein